MDTKDKKEALNSAWSTPTWEDPEIVDFGRAVSLIQGSADCCPDHGGGRIGEDGFTSSPEQYEHLK